MMTFEFGGLLGALFATAFFLVIAELVGLAVYALLVHPRFRRVEARGWGNTSRRTGFLLGGIAALAIFLAAYFSMLNGFYRLDSVEAEGEIRLHYLLPPSTHTIPRWQRRVAIARPAYRGKVRLVVRTEYNGREHISAPADPDTVTRALSYFNEPCCFD